jgi:hypothetical protein
MAGEVIVDVTPDAKAGGTHTVKVGTAAGEVKVTRTQATKASVLDEEVVDVIVADHLGQMIGDGVTPTGTARHYAQGLRDGITFLRTLVGPLAWRTTDLEKWLRRLESVERHDLAIRLGHAFGRVSSGNPRTTIERKAD